MYIDDPDPLTLTSPTIASQFYIIGQSIKTINSGDFTKTPDIFTWEFEIKRLVSGIEESIPGTNFITQTSNQDNVDMGFFSASNN